MVSFNSIRATTLKDSLSKGIVGRGRRSVSLCGPVDHLRSADDNMVGSAQKAAMGRTVDTFEDNRARRCKNFENAVLMVIFETDFVTDAESGGSSVTERHFGRIGAKIGKRRDGLTIRKLLSLQKGVR